jgi:hypothetical protein
MYSTSKMKGVALKATAGDRIVVRGHRIGDPDREAEILEARGHDGGPPYLVRWGEDGHESLFFPGSDAHVVPIAPTEE